MLEFKNITKFMSKIHNIQQCNKSTPSIISPRKASVKKKLSTFILTLCKCKSLQKGVKFTFTRSTRSNSTLTNLSNNSKYFFSFHHFSPKCQIFKKKKKEKIEIITIYASQRNKLIFLALRPQHVIYASILYISPFQHIYGTERASDKKCIRTGATSYYCFVYNVKPLV